MSFFAGGDFLTKLLQRLKDRDGAHGVRVEVDSVDIARSDHIERALEEFLLLPFGRDRYDFDTVVFGYDIIEARAAQLGHVVAHVALQFQHQALRLAVLLGQEGDNRLARLLAAEIVVGLDGHVDFAANGRAVNRVDGNLRSFCAADRGAERLAVHGHGDDGCDVQRDQEFDLVGLQLGIARGVLVDHLPALFSSIAAHAVHDPRLEGVEAGRRVADHDFLVLCAHDRDHEQQHEC